MLKSWRYDDGQIMMPWIMINDRPPVHWYLSWDETVQKRCDLMGLIDQPVAKNEVNPSPVVTIPLRSDDMSFVLEIHTSPSTPGFLLSPKLQGSRDWEAGPWNHQHLVVFFCDEQWWGSTIGYQINPVPVVNNHWLKRWTMMFFNMFQPLVLVAVG